MGATAAGYGFTRTTTDLLTRLAGRLVSWECQAARQSQFGGLVGVH